MIFFVQATADIESRALLALIVISLQLALEPCCANGRSHFITTCIFYVVTCFHMVLHMTIADSRRYPVLWMSLDRLVGGSGHRNLYRVDLAALRICILCTAAIRSDAPSDSGTVVGF